MTLEQRIAALERRLKFYRRLIMVCAAIFVLALIVAAGQDQKTHDMLRTKRLEVVNGSGDRVFIAGSDSSTGHGRVVILNAGATPVVVATGSEDGGTLMFFDENEKLRLSTSADQRGGFLQLLDSDGKTSWSAP